MNRLARVEQSNIFSIFGQLEEVVAINMVDEGKARMIPVDEFPARDALTEHIWTNDVGLPVKFAIQLWSHREVAEFNRRVEALRM